jgi:WD40 repeat protein
MLAFISWSGARGSAVALVTAGHGAWIGNRELLDQCRGLMKSIRNPMVSESAGRPEWSFPAAFAVLGLVMLATINAVRSSNWFNPPDTDDSFLTGYGYSRLSRLSFSPDGRFIATAGTDYTVRVWDAQSGREVRLLRGHTDHRILSVAFSPDGTWLASGGRDRTVRIWDPTTGRPVQTIEGHRDRVMALAISPDGALIATGSRDRSVKIWDTQPFRLRASLGGESGDGVAFVRSVAFHAGSRIVGFGDWFGAVRVWNEQTGNVGLLGRFGRAIYDLAFSPDGRLLASAGHDGRVRLFDIAAASQRHVLQEDTAPVTAVAFSPSGRLLASAGDDRTIRLWNIDERRVERTLVGHAKGNNLDRVQPRWSLSRVDQCGRNVQIVED